MIEPFRLISSKRKRLLGEWRKISAFQVHNTGKNVARPARIELTTHCLEGSCSIQLSYGRNLEYILPDSSSTASGFGATSLGVSRIPGHEQNVMSVSAPI